MNFRACLHNLRLVALVVAGLMLIVLPAAASAKRHKRSHDRNHDGISDKWERKHGLSTRRHGVGKADPDKDGLRNRDEFRARTNPKRADSDGDGTPDASEDGDRDSVDNGNEAREHTKPRRADSDRDGIRDGDEDADRDRLDNAGEDDADTDPINPDTDGDGVEDGDEHAGEIVSFDGTTLTIKVFGGASLTGTVDENTSIECGDDSDEDAVDDEGDYDDSFAARGVPDESADDDLDDEGADDGDDSADDADSLDDEDDDFGDDEDEDYADDDADSTCGIESLTVGTAVAEASVLVTSDGTFFDAIELGAGD